jgi:hypothetical protein
MPVFRVQGSAFGGLGLRGLGFRVSASGFRVERFRLQGLGFRV